MVIGQPVVHNRVQFYSLCCGFGPPPEPFASCLMKRSPNDGNTGLLQPFQLHSNSINVSDGCLVLRCALGHCSEHIEIGEISVEGTGAQTASHGRKPVPMEAHNTFLISGMIPVYCVSDSAIIGWLPVVPRIMRRVVLHIECLYDWVPLHFLHQIIVMEGSLS